MVTRTLSLALLLLVALALGFLWFTAALPDRVETPERRTDAIVVLTGGSERVAEGLRLLAADRAERLLISGVHRDVTVEEILAQAPDLPATLAGRIELGYAAGDTRGNAEEAAAFMGRKGYASLRLVTAAYHMPRGLMEFQRAMPEVEIVAHPVFPPAIDQSHWWEDANSATLLVGEYLKYIVALALGPFRSQG